MKHLLLAEDDADLGNLLKKFLEMSGYTVSWRQDGEQALEFLQSAIVSFCIIDVMMPKMDGFTLAEHITELHPGLPFIFLTARNEKEDRLRGLGLGADDYISKPFEAEELLLRLKNILKRIEGNNFSLTNDIAIGEYLLDYSKLQLKHGNSFIQLTKLDAQLLFYLYENRNKLIVRKDILMAIWKTDDYFTGRSFDVFLSRLRKYLKEDSNIAIKSVRNVGVEFVCG